MQTAINSRLGPEEIGDEMERQLRIVVQDAGEKLDEKELRLKKQEEDLNDRLEEVKRREGEMRKTNVTTEEPEWKNKGEQLKCSQIHGRGQANTLHFRLSNC